jgi:hypothetical protein
MKTRNALTITLILLALIITTIGANVRVYTWTRPADMPASPHMFQNADWAYCVWLGERIIRCDSGKDAQ